MDKSRLEVLPGVWLDHRRAVFLEKERILAVADLHLGYAWAHRYQGQMMPLSAKDDLLGRLRDLCGFYKPDRLVIAGDIVHAAVPVAEILEELMSLFSELSKVCGLKLILGNHDRKLKKLVKSSDVEFLKDFETDGFLLTHGNELEEMPRGKTVIMGHEHPAISLGDGIKSAKFPCFMVGNVRCGEHGEQVKGGAESEGAKSRNHLIMLPAFSHWSAGSDIRSYGFMSPLAGGARFTKAIAICGTKLLPVNLVQ